MRKAFFISCMLMLAGLTSWAQRTISGKVTDENGNPIPGASVVIQNTKTGTVTKDDGSFSLNVPERARVLVITAVGMEPQDVPLGSRTSLSVALKAAADKNLQEVVVTAMGIRRTEKALGYAVSKVDPSTMVQRSEPNVLNTLAGKVPGVDIRAGQGAPGAATRVQIRGVSTFDGANEPLIVVDGVPYSNPLVNTSNPFNGGGTYGSGINNLDPNDIESINVLKGAAAASLYGSRGVNGVILITTKSGAPKKGAKPMNVTYRGGYSLEKVADIPEFQNLYGAGANFRVQSSNGSWGGRFGRGVIYDAGGQVIGNSITGVDSIPATTWATMYASYPELFPNGRIAYKANPDNVKSLFNTGHLMEHSVGFNGGQGNTFFSATLSHVDQDGYITNSSYKKNNISVGATTTAGNLTLGASMSYARSKQIGGYIGAAQSFLSQWGRTYTMARNWDIVGWPTESRAGAQIGFNDGQYTNPVWAAHHNVITSIDDRSVINIRLGYKFTQRLKVEFNGGVNNYSLFRDQIIDRSSLGGSDNTVGNMTEVVRRQQELNGRVLATYSPKMFKDFTLDLNAGVDVNQRETRHQQVYGADFVIAGLFNLTNTRRQSHSADSRSKRRLVGVFADASFGYKGFAYLNITGRTDQSSTLDFSRSRYFYPGASASLIWTQAFKVNTSWLDYGKIRAGYARVGNDANPGQEPIFNLNAAGFLGQPLATRDGTTYDPELTPEFTTELEIGSETRFLKDRVGFELTWYDKKSTDLITAITLPQSTGFNQYYTNLGEIRNTGWEAALDVKPVSTRNVEWSIRGIFTKNKNTVEKLAPGLLRYYLGGYNYGEPGKPYGYLRGSHSARTEDGQLLINPTSGMPFLDPNQDMVGDPNAEYKLGLTNTVSYKGFRLQFLLDLTKGGAFYSETISSMLGRGVTKDTEIRELNHVITGIYGNSTPVTGSDGLNHYTPLLVNGKTVRNQTRVTTNDLFFTQGTGASFATNGAFEYAVFDGTVYRLREVVLSYSLPSRLMNRIKISGITLSLSGRNLWYLAPNLPKYTHFDPDINSVVGSGTQGVESGGAPSTKRYGFNINVIF